VERSIRNGAASLNLAAVMLHKAAFQI
jgi:hypothetical protein